MNILEVRNVTKLYDGKPVVEDISVTLAAGELVCLLGVSGAGKSTLFNVIAGLSRPDAGQVLLRGGDITGKTGQVGYMLQKDLLLPYRTVADNAALPLMLRGVPKEEARAQAVAHFADFGLAGTENKWPHQLSGGMRQRAALLRTYLFSADVCLLDEPFSALDAITKSALHTWYLDMTARLGLTTLFISHDVDEAILLSDRVCVLTGQPGRITGSVTVDCPRDARREFSLSPEFAALKRQLLGML